MSKRSSSEESNCDSNSVEPKAKRRKNVEFEPIRICSISGVVFFCFLHIYCVKVFICILKIKKFQLLFEFYI